MSAGHLVICHNPIYNVLLNKDLEKDGLVQGYYVDGLTKKLAFMKLKLFLLLIKK